MSERKNPETLSLERMVEAFIAYLEVVEESDSGNEFRPNYISSCRVMDSEAMGILLTEMRKRVTNETTSTR